LSSKVVGIVKLEDAVISSNTGADAIKRAPIVEENTGMRCLRIGDISNNRPFSEWGFTKAEEKVISKFLLKKDDIIIARTGNTIGVVKFIEEDLNALYNNGLIRIKVDTNKFYPKYIYYNLDSQRFRDFVYSISGGTSTQPNMKINHTLKYEILDYPLKEQKAIAHILSSIDEKIETNIQINKRLEKMAQAIFKEWFIDYEFPIETGELYKSSGGEMVESELGLIPKGWKLNALYDLADYINGTSFKKGEISEETGIPIIKIAELKQGISHSTKYFNGIKPEKYNLNNGDILFSWSGNPETSIDTFIWYRGEGILNQHIFKVEPYKFGKELIYLILKYYKSLFTSIASNKQTTGLGHVTVSDLKRIKIALPSDKIINEFTNIINPLINEVYTNCLENFVLEKTRNMILPKLMTGEIRYPLE